MRSSSARATRACAPGAVSEGRSCYPLERMSSSGPHPRTAELVFHAVLAGFLVPFVSAPAAWVGFAMTRGSGDPWSRRLLWLALLDTLVLGAVALSAAFGLTDALVAPGGPRIGIVADEGGERGLAIGEVIPGTPAERAGLRAGDTIVAIDGAPIHDVADLHARLHAERTATLTFDRDGHEERVELQPIPLEATTLARAPRTECRPPRPWTPGAWRGVLAHFAPYGVFLVCVLALWVWGRHRKVGQAIVWLPLVAILIGSGGIAALGQALGCLVLGPGARADVVGLLTSELFMVLLGLLFWRAVRSRVEPEPFVRSPPLPTLTAYPLGLFYLVTFTARTMFLAVPIVWLSQRYGIGGTSGMLEELVGAGAADGVDAALVGTLAVVLAPIGEELLFRGIVLPHLARTLQAPTAIALSAVLFGMLHVDHGVLLVGPLTIGLVLGWARWRTGSIGVPILLHTTVNGVAMLVSWTRG